MEKERVQRKKRGKGICKMRPMDMPASRQEGRKRQCNHEGRESGKGKEILFTSCGTFHSWASRENEEEQEGGIGAANELPRFRAAFLKKFLKPPNPHEY